MRVNGVHSRLTTIKMVAGGDPVYLVATLGDDVYAASNNRGLKNHEACLIDATTGHLADDCGQTGGTTWLIQDNTPKPLTPSANYAHDALLYFDYLYTLNGLSTETIDPLARGFNSGTIARFPVNDVTMVTDPSLLLNGYQSTNTDVNAPRAYYKNLRLLSYIYVVGGWTNSGPTDTVERHLQ